MVAIQSVDDILIAVTGNSSPRISIVINTTFLTSAFTSSQLTARMAVSLYRIEAATKKFLKNPEHHYKIDL